jgi:hypothetical protein
MLPGYVEQVRPIVNELEASPPPASGGNRGSSPSVEESRGFPLPGEALAELRARLGGAGVATHL